MTRPALIDLNPNEFNQGLRFYIFMVNLDRFNGSCITLDDQTGKCCVQNKTENVNIYVFNMIIRINKKNINKTYIMRI